MADRPVFLFAAVYDDIDDAEADYLTVVDLHAAGLVGTYDSAVIEKIDGKVHVHKTEKPTQHGAWTGIAVGAVAGISSRRRSSAQRSPVGSPEVSSVTSGRACLAATSRSSARLSTTATPR